MLEEGKNIADDKISKGTKIRNRYNQVPHMTQESQTYSYTPQTRAKRSALSNMQIVKMTTFDESK